MFNPVKLIEEVKKRPGLYSGDHPADREEKLLLWKEVGAAIYAEWDTFNKATAYDKVLHLQRKWRSLRDAYNRELRSRRSGTRINRRVYMYFKRMSFLGGFEGSVSDEEDQIADDSLIDSAVIEEDNDNDPLISKAMVKKPRRRKRMKRISPPDSPEPEEMEMPVFPVEMTGDETDSDRLFLLSFLPEMRQLPVDVKMWARARIASIMQEAVSMQTTFSKSNPGSSDMDLDRNLVKLQRADSSD